MAGNWAQYWIGFFEMGGYAAFVWPSLVLVILVMGGLLGASLADRRAQGRLLAALEAGPRGARRRPRAPTDGRRGMV